MLLKPASKLCIWASLPDGPLLVDSLRFLDYYLCTDLLKATIHKLRTKFTFAQLTVTDHVLHAVAHVFCHEHEGDTLVADHGGIVELADAKLCGVV